MNYKKRSVFFNVFLINSVVSFILICIYLLSFLYFNSRSKRETQNYENNLLITLTQKFTDETNRLSTLTAMLVNDPSIILVTSNKLPADSFSQYAQDSFQKMRMISYSLPYSENTFLYSKPDKKFIFTNAIATISQYDIVKSKGLSVDLFPSDMTLFDFDNLVAGFHPINENYSLYVTNILQYGMLAIKIDTAKFCNLKGINAVLPSYSIAVLDNNNQIFALSSPNVSGLLKNIDLKDNHSEEFTIDNVTYNTLQRNTNEGFRFILIGQTSTLQKLEMQNSLVGTLISISVFIVCIIIILANAMIYNPLRKIARIFGGSNKNEIDFIRGKLLELTSEKEQMQQQILLQGSILTDIELSYAINTKGDITSQTIKQLKVHYGRFRIVVVALQSQVGDGEEYLYSFDNSFISMFHCKVIVIDPYVHAYLISDISDKKSLASAIERYLTSIDPDLLAFIGMSDLCDDFSQIIQNYQQAYERMLGSHIPTDKPYVISVQDSVPNSNPPSVTFEIQNTITRCVLSGSPTNLENIFQHLFFSDASLTLKGAVSIYTQLSNLLLVLLDPANANLKYSDLITSTRKPVYNLTYMYQSLVEDYAKLNKSQEHSAMRYEIVEYINKHYSEPLSLESIAAEFRITQFICPHGLKRTRG